MDNPTFEQRLAMQLGDLIIAIKKLEYDRDQLYQQLKQLQEKVNCQNGEPVHPSLY